MNNKLERLSRRTVLEGRVVDFCRDTVRLPDGVVQEWDFIHHKKGGGACVVPVLPDGRVLAIRQARPAIGEETLELPAGARETPDEEAALTAMRELREETGYEADCLQLLTKLQTADAWCDETTEVFLAQNITPCGGQELDEAEAITIEAHPLDELLDMIFAGEIQDAKTVAGLAAYAVWKARGGYGR